MKIRIFIPNAITGLHLLFGVLGIVGIYSYDPRIVVWVVLVNGVLDFLDGLCARLLGVVSPVGKQLDSMADLVSFGILPGLYLFEVLKDEIQPSWLSWLPLLLPLVTALRLARYNEQKQELNKFRGLPSPAHGFLMVSLPEFAGDVAGWDFMILGVAGLSSWLMLSRVPLLSLKLRNAAKSWNNVTLLLLIVSLPLLFFLHLKAIPLIFVLYLAGSLGLRDSEKEA